MYKLYKLSDTFFTKDNGKLRKWSLQKEIQVMILQVYERVSVNDHYNLESLYLLINISNNWRPVSSNASVLRY